MRCARRKKHACSCKYLYDIRYLHKISSIISLICFIFITPSVSMFHFWTTFCDFVSFATVAALTKEWQTSLSKKWVSSFVQSSFNTFIEMSTNVRVYCICLAQYDLAISFRDLRKQKCCWTVQQYIFVKICVFCSNLYSGKGMKAKFQQRSERRILFIFIFWLKCQRTFVFTVFVLWRCHCFQRFNKGIMLVNSTTMSFVPMSFRGCCELNYSTPLVHLLWTRD